MKKHLLGVLALIAIIFTTGCGSSSDSEGSHEPDEIRVAVSGGQFNDILNYIKDSTEDGSTPSMKMYIRRLGKPENDGVVGTELSVLSAFKFIEGDSAFHISMQYGKNNGNNVIGSALIIFNIEENYIVCSNWDKMAFQSKRKAKDEMIYLYYSLVNHIHNKD